MGYFTGNDRYGVLGFLILGLLLTAPLPAYNKYAGEFLNLGVGARPAGMGQAYVSIVDDATSCYWNPASG